MSTKPVEAGKIAACVAQSNSSTLKAREISGVKLAEKFRRKRAHTQSSTEEGEDGTITVKLHAAQERELVRFYLATEQLRETVASELVLVEKSFSNDDVEGFSEIVRRCGYKPAVRTTEGVCANIETLRVVRSDPEKEF
jgi:hypothetical protein